MHNMLQNQQSLLGKQTPHALAFRYGACFLHSDRLANASLLCWDHRWYTAICLFLLSRRVFSDLVSTKIVRLLGYCVALLVICPDRSLSF
jgi:hypothetical protein